MASAPRGEAHIWFEKLQGAFLWGFLIAYNGRRFPVGNCFVFLLERVVRSEKAEDFQPVIVKMWIWIFSCGRRGGIGKC